MRTILKSLIQESKDGEWGKEEPFKDSLQMSVIRGADFDDVRIGITDGLPVRHIAGHMADRKTLKANDIVFETAGGGKDRPTGRSLFVKPSLVQKSELPLICASFSRYIRIDAAKADPEFMFWKLQHLYSNGVLRKYHTQHTGVARFQYTVFSESEKFDLPELRTQRRIASILSAYDDLIENNTRRIKILEEMAQAIYREWFVEFRAPGVELRKATPEEQKLTGKDKFPKGWEVRTLDEVMDFQGGAQPPKSEWSENPLDGYVRMIQIRDYESDKYVCYVKDSNKLRKCNPKDIMIARYGASVARICWGLEGAYNVALVKVVPSIPGSREFLRTYLQTDYFQKLLIGMSGRAAQAGFNRSNLTSVRLPLPEDIYVLERFEEVAVPLFDQSLVLESKNENLRRTRDLLLPKLISGEVEA